MRRPTVDRVVTRLVDAFWAWVLPEYDCGGVGCCGGRRAS